MQIVVAHPQRTSADPFAEVFQKLGVLKRYVIWARKRPDWLKPELMISSSQLAAFRAAGPMFLSGKAGESWEYALHPLFGRWAARFIEPGDAVFSSFGYCNEAFIKARRLGGITMSNCGNSHPDYFWRIVSEEHERWGIKGEPILRRQYERARAMVELTDYFFCPSSFVRGTYLAKGIPQERIIAASRTFNPTIFKLADQPRKRDVFRVVCPGGVGLRKGSIYLLQAFEKLRREFKDCELVLTRSVRDGHKLFAPYEQMITWIDPLPHPELARFFHRSDVYVLASIEEGLARTGIEAMACGLPIIVTPNTGVNDYVEEGQTGFVVPIRDPEAIYQKLLTLATQPERCAEMGRAAATAMSKLRPQNFAETVAAGLRKIESGVAGEANADKVALGNPHRLP